MKMMTAKLIPNKGDGIQKNVHVSKSERRKDRIIYAANFPIDNQLAPSIHIHEVCNNLSELGYDVTLLAPSIDANIMRNYQFSKVRYLKIVSPITYQLFLFLKLVTSLRRKNTALYVRQESFMFAPQAVARLLRIRTIVEVNGMIEEEVLQNPKLPAGSLFKKLKLFQHVEKTAYKNASKIVTVTPGLKKYLCHKYGIPAEKIVVIENGVNTDEFKPMKIEKKNGKVVVGFIGSLLPYQGLTHILEALQLVTKRDPQVELHVYGTGPEERSLRDMISRLGLEGRVFLKGSIPHDAVPETVNSFDIGVAYYTKERDGMNSPFKVVEYLSCGRPVVVSDIRGVGDRFGEVAYVARAEDTADLADKLASLAGDTIAQQELSSKARSFILSNFTWKRVAQDLSQILEDR